jgi:hypothetical protein
MSLSSNSLIVVLFQPPLLKPSKHSMGLMSTPPPFELVRLKHHLEDLRDPSRMYPPPSILCSQFLVSTLHYSQNLNSISQTLSTSSTPTISLNQLPLSTTPSVSPTLMYPPLFLSTLSPSSISSLCVHSCMGAYFVLRRYY